MSYAELQVTTHFSFLRGASSPQELFAQAKQLRITALGIVDRNSLAGIVRAYEASRETGVRLVIGCRLDLTDGTSLLVYPTNRAAYSRLASQPKLNPAEQQGGEQDRSDHLPYVFFQPVHPLDHLWRSHRQIPMLQFAQK